MSIKYVEGDLFGPVLADKQPGPIVIPHVVNSHGAWGAGFVIPLGKTFPVSRQSYLEWKDDHKLHEDCKYPTFNLGQTQIVNVDNKIFVANMMAQTLGGVRPLFYNHLVSCMETVAKFVTDRNDAREHPARIVCPAFGSALAGGDWYIIEQLIWDSWIRRNIPVTVHYIAGTLPEVEERNIPVSSLKEACTIVFGGVGAMSPEIYSKALEKVADMCDRLVDDDFRSEVADVLKDLPCPLD